MQCTVYEAPKHGSSSCNIRKEGVVETHICTVSCKKDYWFVKGDNVPELYNYYVCGENGQWRGQNMFNPTGVNTFFVEIEKGKTPWPDCAGKTFLDIDIILHSLQLLLVLSLYFKLFVADSL